MSPTHSREARQREQFEDWLWSLDWIRAHHFLRRDMKGSTRFGQYVCAEVEFAWEAWQASDLTLARSFAGEDRNYPLQRAVDERSQKP